MTRRHAIPSYSMASTHFLLLVITVRTDNFSKRREVLLYEVDFSVRINGKFHDVHKALILAPSVSECRKEAEKIRESLPESEEYEVYIFIGA